MGKNVRTETLCSKPEPMVDSWQSRRKGPNSFLLSDWESRMELSTQKFRLCPN